MDKNRSPEIRVERIRSSLRSQLIGRVDALEGRNWRVVMIENGSAEIILENSTITMMGPCLAWLPWQTEMRVRIAAGSTGGYFLLGVSVLAGATSHMPETAELRIMADRPVILDLGKQPELLEDIQGCVSAIYREFAAQRSEFETLIETQIRILLIHMWRSVGQRDNRPDSNSPVQAQRILLQFRNQVEAHCRERWTVAAHAAEIGVSPDRLNDICNRIVGKPPGQLILERLTYEAQLLLERSTESLAQISERLSFGDVGQFSRFFLKQAGLPPSRYRKLLRTSTPDEFSGRSGSYSDWP